MGSRRDIVIIGAPRSGTNMLRDVLTHIPGLATWPCDEINYIWRHGNVDFPSDELAPDQASESNSRYIKASFDRIARLYEAKAVVEKTCANSLRVPFVEAVLDEPYYVNIVRDGLDAVASARKRWGADLEPRYIAAKARFVPLTDMPIYASKYALARARRLASREHVLPTWGPRLHDMDQLVADHNLNAVCAIQWQRCVDASTRDLADIDPARVVSVRYEEYVQDPSGGTSVILEELGRPAPKETIRSATRKVSDGSVGKGRTELGADESRRLTQLVGSTLAAHGYVSG